MNFTIKGKPAEIRRQIQMLIVVYNLKGAVE